MTITSRHNPLVARYRAAARRESDEVILLDGAHLVTDALAAGVRIEHVAMTPAAREHPDLQGVLARLARAGVEIVVVAAPVMDAMSPVRSPSGVVALAAPPAVSGAAIYGAADPLIVVAVGVQDPGNVGAIVRVAEAGGATGVIATGGTADPLGWKALRGSMGSALRLPVVRGTAPADAVAEARRHGCQVIATTPRGGRTLFEIDLTRPTAMLIGGEGRGLASTLVDAADERVSIPMQAPVESLNAAVTAALIVYEAQRQRASQTKLEVRS
jgi:TrmH family RNA methyltransferase